jgi:hypothetical protein
MIWLTNAKWKSNNLSYNISNRKLFFMEDWNMKILHNNQRWESSNSATSKARVWTLFQAGSRIEDPPEF